MSVSAAGMRRNLDAFLFGDFSFGMAFMAACCMLSDGVRMEEKV